MVARQHEPEMIADQIEYAEFLISRDRRREFDNPAGFIIYTIENEVPVPTSFVSSRRLRQQEEKAHKQAVRDTHLFELRAEYDQCVERWVEEEIASRYPGNELKKKAKDVIAQRVRTDDRFSKMAQQHQEALALQFLRKDTQQELTLPTFEQWCEQKHQLNLF